MSKLKEISAWWADEIADLINKEKEEPQKEEAVANPKDKKAPPAKDAKKKGGK